MLANLLKEGKVRIAYARHEEMTEIDNVHGSADPILFKGYLKMRVSKHPGV